LDLKESRASRVSKESRASREFKVFKASRVSREILALTERLGIADLVLRLMQRA
jgi:hypothetical protein